MKKLLLFLSISLFIFIACSTEEPSIVCGKEWNAGTGIVADTSSTFEQNSPLLIQLRYGKNFDFTKLKISFFEGTLSNKGKEIWMREVNVSEKMGSYTLQGKSKNGGLMSAKELTRQKKPGTVVVEFSSEKNLICAKEILITKNK